LLATVAAPLLTASPGEQGSSTQSDAIAQATQDFKDTVARGDALTAAGNYFEAVLAFERAKRVAYNNNLKIDEAALSRKLDAARKARDTKTAAPAPAAASPNAPPPAASMPAQASSS
jgi:hypothetical protein